MWNYTNWSNDSKLIVIVNIFKKHKLHLVVSFCFTNHLIHNQVDYASSELHDSTQRKEIFLPTKTYCSFNKNFTGLLILMQCINKLYLLPIFTRYRMGNSASISQSQSHRRDMPPSKSILSQSSPSCLECISTESLVCFSSDILRLPEKVFRVLVDPSGKGYTVDEKSIDLNISTAGRLSGCNRPVSQMRAPSAGLSRTSRKLWQDYFELLYVLNIKPYIFNPCSIYPHCGILAHQYHTPNDFAEPN